MRAGGRKRKTPVASQQQSRLFSCHLWLALTMDRHPHLLREGNFYHLSIHLSTRKVKTISAIRQGHLLLLFFPHPPARKGEGERGHPAPRKGAAAPLTPACGEHSIALSNSDHDRPRTMKKRNRLSITYTKALQAMRQMSGRKAIPKPSESALARISLSGRDAQAQCGRCRRCCRSALAATGGRNDRSHRVRVSCSASAERAVL
jgi:hypothetical protein